MSEKHTIYVDVDDEITAIIEKVRASPGRIIALVLPKRATVLQSIVNMKLLKISALNAKKNVVLITSETGLMPLAGAVGMHVAPSLQSKPVVPNIPDMQDADEADTIEDDTAVLDASKTVGELAAEAGVDDDLETIALDDEPEIDADTAKVTNDKKQKKGFKVPNFDRFRLGVVFGTLLVIALVVGWAFAFIILPKATIAITTDTSTNTAKIDFTANTKAQDLDLSKAIIPAVQKEIKKTDTEKTTATGKKDNGTKATGTMTLTNCINDGAFHTVPAGTGFSAGAYTFVTNEAVTLDPALFSGQTCKSSTFKLDKDVTVTAAKGGADYNLTARSYVSSVSGITAYGGVMTGGTTSLVTVVSQEDIDTAAAKMKNRLDAAAKKELAATMTTSGLKTIDETLTISDPIISATPVVGTESATEVTVTAITTYAQVGIKSDYLSQLIKKDVATKIDTTKQSVLDDGLDASVIRVVNKKSPTEIALNIQAIVTAGPQLNAETIKNEIKGKKRGDVESIIGKKIGVKDVTVTYSPFWVLSTPKSIKKISVTIQKPVVVKQTSPTYIP